jgi:tetratricopeptide (TPR) repeat protein
VGWELWAPLNALYTQGRYVEAADRARALVETQRPYAGVLYNLACCESLAGRPDEAVEHLRQAVELSERFRTLAQDDPDLGAIRDEAGFKQLLATRA